jgi:flagellar hook-length control protein FliK
MRARGRKDKAGTSTGGIALMWRGGCIIRSRFPRRHQGSLRQESEARPTCCWTTSSRRAQQVPGGWRKAWRTGAKSASRRRRSPRAGVLRFGYRTARCRRTCSRPSATTSARTPTSAPTSRAASSSTPTGPARAASSSREALRRGPRERPATQQARCRAPSPSATSSASTIISARRRCRT